MKFKEWCKEKGYTALDIEAKTGIPRKTIWSYWHGARTPSRATEKKLKELVGIPSGLFD